MNQTKLRLLEVIWVLMGLMLFQYYSLHGQAHFALVDDLPYVATDIAFDEEGTRYVTLQQGVILKGNDTLMTVPTWFLNEMGLVAVLPSEHYIFFHCTGVDSVQRVIRYDTIAAVYDTLVEVPYTHPFSSNHHGGDIVRDGNILYSSFGYGGDRNDAQDTSEYRGKIITTDLTSLTNTIYATGLRNPFRIALDPNYEQLWVADVGSNVAEEVNILLEGESGGWPCWEGDSLLTIEDTCWASVFPVYFYSQAQPRYIIGGDFYDDEYFWTDAGSGVGGRIDSFGFNTPIEYPNDLTSMAVDPVSGNLYVIEWIGKIYVYIPDTTVLAINEEEEEELPERPEETPLWYADYCTGYIDVFGRRWGHPPIGIVYFDCQTRQKKIILKE